MNTTRSERSAIYANVPPGLEQANQTSGERSEPKYGYDKDARPQCDPAVYAKLPQFGTKPANVMAERDQQMPVPIGKGQAPKPERSLDARTSRAKRP